MRDPQIVGAINWPTPEMAAEWPSAWADGATEPWTQQVVAALLNASFARHVLELGTYTGYTSVWLCTTLQRMGGGRYLGVELDGTRQAVAVKRLAALRIPDVEWQVVQADSLTLLASLTPHTFDFAWVDDDHTPAHVAKELEALHNPTMPSLGVIKPGGLICMHDVCGGALGLPPLKGVCQSAHGYALEWPRIGLLGGLGIIQVPR